MFGHAKVCVRVLRRGENGNQGRRRVLNSLIISRYLGEWKGKRDRGNSAEGSIVSEVCF